MLNVWAVVWPSRWSFPWLILGAGALLLVISALVLIRTRWGQVKPLTKCLILSLWAHLILLGFAHLTIHWPDPRSRLPEATMRVQWADAAGLADEDDPSATANEAVELLSVDPQDVPAEGSDDAPPVDAAATAVVEPGTVDQATDPADSQPLDQSAEVLTSDASPGDDSEGDLNAENMPAEPVESVRVPSPTDDNTTSATGPAATGAGAPVEQATRTEGPTVDAAASPQTPVDDEIVLPADDLPVATAEDTSDEPLPSVELPTPSVDEGAEATANAIAESPRKTSVESNPSADSHEMPRVYQGRMAARRQELLTALGGTRESEEAVRDGLAWLAQAQSTRDGHWDARTWGGGHEVRDLEQAEPLIRADTALTGLAMLAYLGAGHTHQQGDYQTTMTRAVEYLLRQQRPNGSLAGNASTYVAMYCHGMATLALSEAFVMSGDQRLRPAMERAIRYTVATQHPVAGGWRYVPGDEGDTSQFGWQLMGLVSAREAGVSCPPDTWPRAQRWLERVSLGSHGGKACYTPDRRIASPSMTAEAAVCRLFLDEPIDPLAWNECAEYLIAHPPTWQGSLDLYYTYYATLALHLAQDERWPTWNRYMQRSILPRQRRDGQLAGSWDTDSRWGNTGGRVYTTSMACLCLETYYRYLPVYRLAQRRGNEMPSSVPR